MHVIQVPVRAPRRKRHLKRNLSLILLVALLAASVANYVRPLPPVTFTITPPSLPATSVPQLSWPTEGQAAVAAAGYSLLGTNGNQQPLATASIAKVIAALCVLQKEPLSIGQAGPTITIGPIDVGFYTTYQAQNGSLVPVTLGEQLTERQALEALMVPSANNIAETIVRWAFGSQADYQAYATQYLTQNGLNSTHIGIDASGFDASTTSTASDLAKLGLLALQSPVLMNIASEHSVELPVAGTVYNYNTVLGQAGITGLKTGNNDADPGAFLFTANVSVGDKIVPVSGSVMGISTLDQALASSVRLVSSMGTSFEQVTTVRQGQIVGSAHAAWGGKTPIIASKRVQLVRWKASAFSERHTIRPVAGTTRSEVGVMEISAGSAHASTPLAIRTAVPGPSFWWRLTRH